MDGTKTVPQRLEPFFCSNLYDYNIVSLLFWHSGTHIIYHWVLCQALLLLSQRNIHFLITHMISNIKMSHRTALKRFPKEWNRFFVQIFTVLTLYLFCSGILGYISYITGLGARQSIS